jgi:hypothetical protein
MIGVLNRFSAKLWSRHFDEEEILKRSQDSSVGLVVGYKLNGWSSVPGMGRIFPSCTASRPAFGVHTASHPVDASG